MCGVYVPISLPHIIKMSPQRRLRIYVAYKSPYIIKYLEPITRDFFTARFGDCHFDESKFPLFGERIRSWKKKSVGMNYHCLILILEQNNMN